MADQRHDGTDQSRRRRRPGHHPQPQPDRHSHDECDSDGDACLKRSGSPPGSRAGIPLPTRSRPKIRTPEIKVPSDHDRSSTRDSQGSRVGSTSPTRLGAKPSSRGHRNSFSGFGHSERPKLRVPSEASSSNPEYLLPDAGIRRSVSARTPRAPKSPVSSAGSGQSSRSSSPGVLGGTVYRYRALRDKEFRLVRIFPATTTKIKCEIVHELIENRPVYMAISYAWGDARDTKKIQIGDSDIAIPASLYGALRAVRYKEYSVLVWADAICIDQQNHDERTEQVGLMSRIYNNAASVAVWLGPEADDSVKAIEFLQTIANQFHYPEKISSLIRSPSALDSITAVASLFERDFWKRLWVVQEIYNAKNIYVYCGDCRHPWKIYNLASEAFHYHREDLDSACSAGIKIRNSGSLDLLAYSQALVHQGPRTLLEIKPDEGSLLNTLRSCRRKLSSDPRDKLYAVLGVLPAHIRREFRADYTASLKDVYAGIVDYLIRTTESLDVICDAIYFPLHSSNAKLPSFVPDWSHVPHTAALSATFDFEFGASLKSLRRARFIDEGLNLLEVNAVNVDTVDNRGIAVGTFCTVADYLMAFLQWHALLLEVLAAERNPGEAQRIEENFCRTISLDRVPSQWQQGTQWKRVTYHVFGSLLRQHFPHLPLHPSLTRYADDDVGIQPRDRRKFLQKHFGDYMIGRCFFRTRKGLLGMGSGFMLPEDKVVVPFGCSTPILLRPEGSKGEYRFVGDVYVHGFMYGKAINEWERGAMEERAYVLH